MDNNFKSPHSHQPYIERRLLLDKLSLATRHRLTLIIAPPGYGKTTLVSQYVQTTNIPTAWQTLEKQDHDLPNLFEHALDALSQVAPNFGNVNSTGRTARELAAATTDYLRKSVTGDFLYVIDDVHHLLDSKGAQIWLKSFVAELPSTCHLILIGQALPPLVIAELIARGEVISIGQEQLSFSREEVGILADQVDANLPTAQLDSLYSRMMGWPAGTLLALQPLPSAIEATLFEGEKAPETLFSALAHRLFYAQPPALQSFLLSASTLSRMTPHLCKSALGLQNSLEHLTDALRRNLFIAEIPTGVVFHSLFREFLQCELELRDFDQFIQHHIHAGEWFERENRLDEAFNHFTQAKQWERAMKIADRAAQQYMANGKVETLLNWKTQLMSLNLIVPRLLHMCAMIHRDRYEYEAANQALVAATKGFKTQGDETGLAQIILLKATIDNQLGHFQQAIDSAKPFTTDPLIAPNLRGYAIAIVGTATLYLGNLEAALEILETALPLWRATGDAFAVAHLLMTLEVNYFRLGRFHDATRCVQEALSIRRSFGTMHGVALVLNNLGYHQYLVGEYQESRKTLNEALQNAQRVPETRAESSVLWTLGDLQRDQGAFEEAAALYHKSLFLMGDSEPFLKAATLVSFANLRRWQGNLPEAQKLARDAKAIAEQHNLHWELQLATLALHAIGIEQGDLAGRAQQLEAIVNEWKIHPAPQLAQVLGLAAYASLLNDDAGTAHQYLKSAVTNTSHPANLQPLVAEVVHTPLLKTFVSHHAIRYAVLLEGIRDLEAAQRELENLDDIDEAVDIKATYSLRISVLGHETVERDGKKIPISDWQAASARELFFYLLFKRPSTREEIGLALWPDSSSQQLRQKFHTTIHRMRDAVGANAIVFEDELYKVNPCVDLWCDVFEFKAAIKQARLSSPLLVHTEVLWQRAVDLYQGDFLPAFDVDWVVAYREAITQQYVEALVGLAQCVRQRGDLQRAIDLLKRALEVDPLQDELHCLLLRDYHTLGQHSMIVRHMQSLTRIFWDELRSSPSPEILKLYKALLG